MSLIGVTTMPRATSFLPFDELGPAWAAGEAIRRC